MHRRVLFSLTALALGLSVGTSGFAQDKKAPSKPAAGDTAALPARTPAPPAAQILVKRAPDNCQNAYAVLGWSNFVGKRRIEPWRTLGFVMHSKSFWHIVPDVKPGEAQKAAFYHYKVHGHENGSAYVAHCGNGATCNAIAISFNKAYRHIGKPMVYCGLVPNVIHSPTKPEIYKPTTKELARWNDANIGAFLFSGGPSADDLVDQF